MSFFSIRDKNSDTAIINKDEVLCIVFHESRETATIYIRRAPTLYIEGMTAINDLKRMFTGL